MQQNPLSSERTAAVRRRSERLATLLDSAVGIPGTRWRVGLDAVIGLIPGVGDLIGLVLGAWFLVEGARAGAPSALLLRMAGNIALDALAGVIPVVGDIADLAFKANRRNARLLIAHLDQLEGRGSRSRSSWVGYGLAALALLAIPLALYGAWQLVARVIG